METSSENKGPAADRDIIRRNVSSMVSEAVDCLKNREYAEGAVKLRKAKALADENDIPIPEYEMIDKKLWGISDHLLKSAASKINGKKYKLAFTDIETAKKISQDNPDILKKADSLTDEMAAIVQNGIGWSRERIREKDYERAYNYLTYMKDYFVNPPKVSAEIDELIDNIKEQLEDGGGSITTPAGSSAEKPVFPDGTSLRSTETEPEPKGNRSTNIKKLVIPVAAMIAAAAVIFYVYSPSFMNLRSRLLKYVDESSEQMSAEMTQSSGQEEALKEETSEEAVPSAAGREQSAPAAFNGEGPAGTPPARPTRPASVTPPPAAQGNIPPENPQAPPPGTDLSEAVTASGEAEQESDESSSQAPSGASGNGTGPAQEEEAAQSRVPRSPLPPGQDLQAEINEMLDNGKKYRDGIGVTQDYELALDCFKRAADLGSPEGRELLSETTEYMTLTMENGTDISPAEQKRLIAGYIGCSSQDLRFLETAVITDGRFGVLYDYDNGSGSYGELKFLITDDGGIFGFTPDQGLSDVRNYFR